jgi:hypothetical protein
MLGVTSIRFAARKVSPAVCFAKPLPAAPRVKRGAVPAQQFHLAAAYSIVHGYLPLDRGFPDATPGDAIASLNRRDCFESALWFPGEATTGLTDVLRAGRPLELLAVRNFR